MLIRSVTPAHGIGRFASIRGACVPVKPPVTMSTGMVPIE